MSRDISLRKQVLSQSTIMKSSRYFYEAINCGFIQDLKMYSISCGSIIAARDLSCNVVIKNIKEYYWLKITHDEKMTGLLLDDKGYVYFKLKLCNPQRPSAKMRMYFSSSREDLISVAMSKKAYNNYIKDTKQILDTIYEDSS